MANLYLRLHVHVVWTTRDRAPLLQGHIEARVYRCIRSECEQLGVRVLALGGTADHVHALLRLPTTVALSTLMKQIKGVSARVANATAGAGLRWQSGYGAFSVSAWDLPRVVRYIEQQRQHHAEHTLSRTLEPIAAPRSPRQGTSLPIAATSVSGEGDCPDAGARPTASSAGSPAPRARRP